MIRRSVVVDMLGHAWNSRAIMPGPPAVAWAATMAPRRCLRVMRDFRLRRFRANGWARAYTRNEAARPGERDRAGKQKQSAERSLGKHVSAQAGADDRGGICRDLTPTRHDALARRRCLVEQPLVDEGCVQRSDQSLQGVHHPRELQTVHERQTPDGWGEAQDRHKEGSSHAKSCRQFTAGEQYERPDPVDDPEPDSNAKSALHARGRRR